MENIRIQFFCTLGLIWFQSLILDAHVPQVRNQFDDQFYHVEFLVVVQLKEIAKIVNNQV